jgi:phytoene dehydrogenase-like protein
MSELGQYDAIVVGAGPNGLAAAITLARAGRGVLVIEAGDTVGGGARTAELTLPGFLHDPCSAIHPLGLASPFFRSLSLEQYGLSWIHPDIPLAHPLDDGSAVALERSVEATGEGLGVDARTYRQLMQPLVEDYEKILQDLLGPFPFPPRYPLATARFGLSAIRPAHGLAEGRFRGERARAVFAGMAAHSILPLEQPATASFGLMLGMLGHAVGWPIPAGGSQSISNALASCLRSLGGVIQTSRTVLSSDEFPPNVPVLYDVTPRQLLKIAGKLLPAAYRRTLEHFRYGPGVFKVDYALAGPIPWKAEAPRRAGKSPPRRGQSGTGGLPKSPLSWSPSKACLTAAAPLLASIPPGSIVTSPADTPLI